MYPLQHQAGKEQDYLGCCAAKFQVGIAPPPFFLFILAISRYSFLFVKKPKQHTKKNSSFILYIYTLSHSKVWKQLSGVCKKMKKAGKEKMSRWWFSQGSSLNSIDLIPRSGPKWKHVVFSVFIRGKHFLEQSLFVTLMSKINSPSYKESSFKEYSWPLNNMVLSCMGSLIHGFFFQYIGNIFRDLQRFGNFSDKPHSLQTSKKKKGKIMSNIVL